MTIFNALYGALQGLVGSRVYEDAFPQTPQSPVVPAIRVTLVGGEVHPDLCGNDIATGDPRYQLDVIDATPQARNALVLAVCAALDALAPPAVLQGLPSNSYDTETKTWLATFDYVFMPSSSA